MTRSTAPLLPLGILLCDFGAMLNSNAMAGLLWHFPGSTLFLISLMTTSYAVSALLPLLFRSAMAATGAPYDLLLFDWVGVVLAASLGAAAAVSVSGLIGFVGIIVPHAVRLAFGASHRVLVPLSILFGGAFMVLADLAARTIVEPAELPIGVVTAFLGAPFFVLVLRTSRRSVW